jgi:hypothetical protein
MNHLHVLNLIGKSRKGILYMKINRSPPSRVYPKKLVAIARAVSSTSIDFILSIFTLPLQSWSLNHSQWRCVSWQAYTRWSPWS